MDPMHDPEVRCKNTTTHVEESSDHLFTTLPWYHAWVRQQVRNQPQSLFLAVPGMTTFESDEEWRTQFLPLWNKFRDLMLVSKSKSIEDIANDLVDVGLLSVTENYEAYQSAKNLVFALLSWQTMLYKPIFSLQTPTEYTLYDELEGYHGESRVCLSQGTFTSKVNIPGFLLGFGMMLPPQNYCGSEELNDRNLFKKTRHVAAKDLNAHVLTKICGVKIQWVDSLSCHLELDVHSETLFLYRYPSFCLENLRAPDSSILRYCAVEGPQSIPWANANDVSEILQEVLLSYRLLFGQTRRSRSLYRRLRPFGRRQHQATDQLLPIICGRKDFNLLAKIQEREEYDLSNDFPHFRSKIVRLDTYASGKKPRSIRQLWRDKRDSTAWLAFWSVLTFGAISIVLGAIQTVFQIMQYVHEVQQGS